jgi:hypothetical protein
LTCFSYFEDLAINVLTIFDDYTDDRYNLDILMSKITYFNLNILQMAEIGDCKRFISQPTVQNILTSIWLGQESYKTGYRKTIKVSSSMTYAFCIIFKFVSTLVSNKLLFFWIVGTDSI